MQTDHPSYNILTTSDPILSGRVCPYCGRQTVLTDSAEIYNGVSYGPIYLCRRCNAFVGCHKGTTIALGRLADAELREAKKAAHGAFDRLWNRRLNPNAAMSRQEAYGWLSRTLRTKRSITHIGMFDIDTCRRATAVCLDLITKTNTNIQKS